MITVELKFKDSDPFEPYVFDKHNPNWTRNHEHNLFFIRAVLNNKIDVLRARGHVLLNDVYDALGAPRTVAGAVFGWALDFGRHITIDFELYSDVDDMDGSIKVHFKLLDVVIDKIESAHQLGVARFNISHSD